MIQIELQPEIEGRFAAEARARGIALERYIADKLTEMLPDQPARQASVSEGIHQLRFLRKGNRLAGVDLANLIREGRKY